MGRKFYGRLLGSLLLIFCGALTACGVLGGIADSATPVAAPTEEAATVAPPPTAAEVTTVPETKEAPTEESTAPPPAAEGAITLENVHTLEETSSVDVSSTVLLSAEFAPEGHRLATYGFDKLVRIYDAAEGALRYELRGHGDYGYSAVWSPDGARLASGGDFTLKIWDTANGDLLSSTQVNSYGFRLAWDALGERVAIVGEPSSHVEIVGRDGGKVEDLQPSGNVMWAVAWSGDGTLLAASDTEAQVFVYDAETYELAKELPSSASAWDLEFSPDGSLLAACDDGGTIEIWQTSDWSRTLTTQADNVDCTDGAFSSDGSIYFTVGDESKLIAWNPLTGAQLATISLGKFPWWVSVSGDDSLVAVALDDGTYRIFGLK